MDLQAPKDSIVALLDPTTILGISYAAAAVAFIVAGQVVVQVLVAGVNKFFRRNDVSETKNEHSDAPSEQASSSDEEAQQTH